MQKILQENLRTLSKIETKKPSKWSGFQSQLNYCLSIACCKWTVLCLVSEVLVDDLSCLYRIKGNHSPNNGSSIFKHQIKWTVDEFLCLIFDWCSTKRYFCEKSLVLKSWFQGGGSLLWLNCFHHVYFSDLAEWPKNLISNLLLLYWSVTIYELLF